MATGLFTAGTRITAALLNSVAPQAVIKPTDQQVTSSTTLISDSALVITNLFANATYLLQLFLDYEGGTQGSSDLKFGWTVPAAATIRAGIDFVTTAGALGGGIIQTEASVSAVGSNGAGNLRAVRLSGTLVMSSTAGSLQLKWAQNTSNATPTVVHAQSSLALWRVT